METTDEQGAAHARRRLGRQQHAQGLFKIGYGILRGAGLLVEYQRGGAPMGQQTNRVPLAPDGDSGGRTGPGVYIYRLLNQRGATRHTPTG